MLLGTSALALTIVLPVLVIAQHCVVQEFILCHELCDASVRSNSVKGVYFTGLLANLTCLRPEIEVR
jgi:hypothetical protein